LKNPATAPLSLAATPPVRTVYTGWVPTSLPNVAGFWSANSGVTQTSGDVSAWADQTSSGFNFGPETSRTDPTWSATSFNTSYPGVTFVNASDGLMSSNMGTFITPTISVFCAITITGESGANCGVWGFIPGGGGDYAPPGIGMKLNNGIEFESYGILGNTGNIAPYPLGVPQCWGAIIDGSSLAHLYQNFVELGSPNSWGYGSLGGTLTNNFSIGSNAIRGSMLGTMAWIVLVKGVMSSTDMANLRSWSNTKFGTRF
jgi:hypothetical protein